MPFLPQDINPTSYIIHRLFTPTRRVATAVCTAAKAGPHTALQAPCFAPWGQSFTFVTYQTTTARRDLFMTYVFTT